MSTRYVVNAPRVVHKVIDGEVVAIDLGSGVYYSMCGPAAVIWDALASGLSTDRVVEHVEATHEVNGAEVASDVAALIDELVAFELLVAGEPQTGALHAFGEGLAYETPVIESFTDMADVILLDPVHDVDATQGWPHRLGADGVAEDG